MSESAHITRILNELASGDDSAAHRLAPLVYTELRALAERYFRNQKRSHTLQPTALVHEAFVRLAEQDNQAWQSRVHFFAVAATAMRQVLVNHAVARNTAKRGGQHERVALELATPADGGASVFDALALDDALRALATKSARMHQIVELRFFGGLAMDEIAKYLNVSLSTVESDWRAAKAWLNQQLTER